jgi:hypothetical protein
VIDNLLDRAKGLLAGPTYAQRQLGGRTVYRRAGSTVDERQPSESELYAAAVAVAGIPTLQTHGTERAPAVYSHDGFVAVLDVVSNALPSEFATGDLDAILRLALTDWVASDLASTREGMPEPADRALSPEEAVEVQITVEAIASQLPSEVVPVLRLKYAGLSDQDIGMRLGLSRPTVAKRKQEAFDVVREHLSDTTERIQDAVVGDLQIRLSRMEQ